MKVCGIFAAFAAAATIGSGSSWTSTVAAEPAVNADASCKSYAVHRYPGSTLGHLRYGEVVFTVMVCPTRDASSWAPKAVAHTNGTAVNIGFSIDSYTLTAYETGENQWNRYGRYEGTFTSKSCMVPWVKQGCYGSGTWRERFTITADKKSHVVHIFQQGEKTPDAGLTMYSTP